MSHDTHELVRVKRHQVLAKNLRVNIGCVRNTKRIVRMNGEDFGFGANKLFEIVCVAGNYVVFRILLPE